MTLNSCASSRDGPSLASWGARKKRNAANVDRPVLTHRPTLTEDTKYCDVIIQHALLPHAAWSAHRRLGLKKFHGIPMKGHNQSAYCCCCHQRNSRSGRRVPAPSCRWCHCIPGGGHRPIQRPVRHFRRRSHWQTANSHRKWVGVSAISGKPKIFQPLSRMAQIDGQSFLTKPD